MSEIALLPYHIRKRGSTRLLVEITGKGMRTMKKLLIMIGIICYCVSPDLFYGPIDDAIVTLGGMMYTLASARAKGPKYMKANQYDYFDQTYE